jgi:hypothetical protein
MVFCVNEIRGILFFDVAIMQIAKEIYTQVSGVQNAQIIQNFKL